MTEAPAASAQAGKTVLLMSGTSKIKNENPDDFEARAFRIAGATDFRAALAGNDAESMRTIKDRGRWSSEIHAIYQRPLLSVQLHASAVVGATREVGLEDVIAGFAQPARR